MPFVQSVGDQALSRRSKRAWSGTANASSALSATNATTHYHQWEHEGFKVDSGSFGLVCPREANDEAKPIENPAGLAG
jgi:hypothetical protein